ncbi:SNRPN upstream reading frame protein [Myotis myotis]|uniref:SNRPN upstream reading frame protein n=1 Tax=Myotis myotis TaxID=51298 RepID=UPI001748F957|nr:SNRPN upstream reading frame protein [Myotis myotis]
MAAAAVARGVQGAGAKGRGTAAHRSQCRSGGGAEPGACAEPRGRALGGGLMPPSPKCRSGRGCGPAQAHRTAVGGLQGGLLRRLRPARRAATPIASLKPLPSAAAAQSREGGGRMQAGWRGLCHAAAPPRRTMWRARRRALCAGATPACAARLDEHPEERGRDRLPQRRPEQQAPEAAVQVKRRRTASLGARVCPLNPRPSPRQPAPLVDFLDFQAELRQAFLAETPRGG